MTDLDDELREAGRRWRADGTTRAAGLKVNTAAPSKETRSAIQGPMRRWAPALAAAVVLAVVVATIVALQSGHATRPAEPTKPSLPFGLPTDVGAMGIHDGEKVKAVGQVITSGGTNYLCTHVGTADAAILRTSSSSAVPPSPGCGEMTIARLVGAALPKNASAVELTGTYSQGTITVDQASATDSDYAFAGVISESFETPCAPPAGGWNSPTGSADYPSDAALVRYLDEHRDRIGADWMSTPDPNHKLPSSDGGTQPLQIRAIGVAGGTAEVDQVRSDLASRYDGELCVYPVPYSYTQQDAAGRQAVGIVGSALIQPGHDSQQGVEFVEAKLLTVDQATRLAALGNAIIVYPHVWPLR